MRNARAGGCLLVSAPRNSSSWAYSMVPSGLKEILNFFLRIRAEVRDLKIVEVCHHIPVIRVDWRPPWVR